MKYGEGPPDGFSDSEWRTALHLQGVPPEQLTESQRRLVERPRLWNGRDPHGDLWTARQRREWDAAIYNAMTPLFELDRAA
jgi:hypothetical protein